MLLLLSSLLLVAVGMCVAYLLLLLFYGNCALCVCVYYVAPLIYAFVSAILVLETTLTKHSYCANFVYL